MTVTAALSRPAGVVIMTFASLAASVEQRADEVVVLQGVGAGALFQVGAGAVTALDHLVVHVRVAHLGEAGGELAGGLRSDAVVLGGAPDQRLGIVRVGLEVLVG